MKTFIDNSNGYERYSNGGKYVHREIMKPILLDALEELFPDIKWNVHHKDGDKSNNDIFNLEIMTHEEHTSMNMKGNKFRVGKPSNMLGQTLDKSPNWGRGIIDKMGGINELKRLKNIGLLKREVAKIFGTCESNIEYYLRRRETKWSEL